MESKGFKGGWNSLGKVNEDQVQSYLVPKQKEKLPQNPSYRPPNEKLSCSGNNTWDLGLHGEEARAQAEHPSSVICYDSTSSM